MHVSLISLHQAKSNRGRQSANQKQKPPKLSPPRFFKTHEFGYRRITIERPLRQSYQFSDERIATLRFESGALNSVMQWAYAEFANLPNTIWSDAPDCRSTMATSAATKKRSAVTSKPISPISRKANQRSAGPQHMDHRQNHHAQSKSLASTDWYRTM